jgi:hypothetical protein
MATKKVGQKNSLFLLDLEGRKSGSEIRDKHSRSAKLVKAKGMPSSMKEICSRANQKKLAPLQFEGPTAQAS